MTDIKLNVTTNAIYHALFRLLENKSFDAITVNDICQESLISRTTFYSYFEDKYILVLFCFAQERKNLGLIKGMNVENNLLSFLKRIKSKKVVYRNLLVSHINQELRSLIADQFKDIIDDIIEKDVHGDERRITIMLYTGGISYIIMRWIEEGCIIDENLIAKTVWDQIPRI